jgi:hypothetical protein
MMRAIEKHFRQQFQGDQESNWFRLKFNWDWSLTSFTKKKALSVDLIPDLIITDIKDPIPNKGRIRFLKQLVNKILNHNEYKEIMTGRLLCLNKVVPRDPRVGRHQTDHIYLTDQEIP